MGLPSANQQAPGPAESRAGSSYHTAHGGNGTADRESDITAKQRQQQRRQRHHRQKRFSTGRLRGKPYRALESDRDGGGGGGGARSLPPHYQVPGNEAGAAAARRRPDLVWFDAMCREAEVNLYKITAARKALAKLPALVSTTAAASVGDRSDPRYETREQAEKRLMEKRLQPENEIEKEANIRREEEKKPWGREPSQHQLSAEMDEHLAAAESHLYHLLRRLGPQRKHVKKMLQGGLGDGGDDDDDARAGYFALERTSERALRKLVAASGAEARLAAQVAGCGRALAAGARGLRERTEALGAAAEAFGSEVGAVSSRPGPGRFAVFRRLPLDLRLLIWEAALPHDVLVLRFRGAARQARQQQQGEAAAVGGASSDRERRRHEVLVVGTIRRPAMAVTCREARGVATRTGGLYLLEPQPGVFFGTWFDGPRSTLLVAEYRAPGGRTEKRLSTIRRMMARGRGDGAADGGLFDAVERVVLTLADTAWRSPDLRALERPRPESCEEAFLNMTAFPRLRSVGLANESIQYGAADGDRVRAMLRAEGEAPEGPTLVVREDEWPRDCGYCGGPYQGGGVEGGWEGWRGVRERMGLSRQATHNSACHDDRLYGLPPYKPPPPPPPPVAPGRPASGAKGEGEGEEEEEEEAPRDRSGRERARKLAEEYWYNARRTLEETWLQHKCHFTPVPCFASERDQHAWERLMVRLYMPEVHRCCVLRPPYELARHSEPRARRCAEVVEAAAGGLFPGFEGCAVSSCRSCKGRRRR